MMGLCVLSQGNPSITSLSPILAMSKIISSRCPSMSRKSRMSCVTDPPLIGVPSTVRSGRMTSLGRGWKPKSEAVTGCRALHELKFVPRMQNSRGYSRILNSFVLICAHIIHEFTFRKCVYLQIFYIRKYAVHE